MTDNNSKSKGDKRMMEEGTAIVKEGSSLKAFVPYSKNYVMFFNFDDGKYIKVDPEVVKQVYNILSEMKEE